MIITRDTEGLLLEKVNTGIYKVMVNGNKQLSASLADTSA